MIQTTKSRFCPVTVFYILRLKYISLSNSIRSNSQIINTFMITKATRPRTITIFIFSISEGLFVIFFQYIIYIINDFPVYKILRFHYWNTWIHMHRSTRHIISIAYTNNIWIRDIGPNDWVFKCRYFLLSRYRINRKKRKD